MSHFSAFFVTFHNFPFCFCKSKFRYQNVRMFSWKYLSAIEYQKYNWPSFSQSKITYYWSLMVSSSIEKVMAIFWYFGLNGRTSKWFTMGLFGFCQRQVNSSYLGCYFTRFWQLQQSPICCKFEGRIRQCIYHCKYLSEMQACINIANIYIYHYNQGLIIYHSNNI